MTYEQAMEYIHSVVWRGSKPGLSRTRELLTKLGNPEQKLRFVHVAGTNGKGSVCAMLSSVLREAGYSVGLYTSPYLQRFNERIQWNGKPIPDEELAEITQTIRPYAESMEDLPTEFELITAVAMCFFLRQQCDIVILEAGMGGALDSTNVIGPPEVAVLTNIGLDHMKELGSTIAAIAETKAGILKSGCLAAFYGKNPEAEGVVSRVCREKGIPLCLPQYESLRVHRHNMDGVLFDYGPYEELTIPLLGGYQCDNAALAICVIELLRKKGWRISTEAIRAGLARTSWPGRFEILLRRPFFVFDGGHNPQGIQATTETLRSLFPDRKVLFLMGVMADKKVDEMLRIMVPLAHSFYTVTPANPRALPAEALASRIREQGGQAEACRSVPCGLDRVLADAAAKNLPACSIGSLYLYQEIRRALEEHGAQKRC